MADYRVLTLQGGIVKQIQDTNGLIVGNKITRDASALAANVDLLTDSKTNQIDIGRTGQLVNIKGNLKVDGTQEIVGDATFDEDVVFGDGLLPPDHVSFRSTIGNGTDNDFIFTDGSQHIIGMETAPGASSNYILIQGQASTTGLAGSLFMAGGASGGGNGNGGNITLDGGLANGIGTNGSINIGNTNTSYVGIGSTGVTPTQLNGSSTLGTATTDYVTFNGYVDSDIEFRSGTNRLILIDAAAADTAGDRLTVSSGIGGVAASSNGGAGGDLRLYSADGGNGDATYACGRGGHVRMRAGTAGIAAAGGGAIGGMVEILAGDAITATAENLDAGHVYIDSGVPTGTGQSRIYIGSSTGGGQAEQIEFSTANTLRLLIDSNGVIQVQAGAEISCTGTGNIILPNDATQSFGIRDTGGVNYVSNTVTAPNLDTLTAGPTSNADALHTHTGISGATSVAYTGVLGEAISYDGQPVAAEDNGASAMRLYLAIATDDDRIFVLGLSDAAYSFPGNGTIVSTGEVTVNDSVWGGVPTYPGDSDVGKPVFLDSTAGQLLSWGRWQTNPLTTGYRVKVGICTRARTVGTKAKVYVQVGEVVFIA